MPCELAALMVAFAPLFSKPVFQHAQVLLMGALLAPRKRTVTAALRVMELRQEPHFQTYYRVLNRAVWCSLATSRILLNPLVRTFALTGVLVMGLDNTIERRPGEKITALGIYRDPVRSSRSHFVLWSHQHFQIPQSIADIVRVPHSLLERLTETLCYAASTDKVELRAVRLSDLLDGLNHSTDEVATLTSAIFNFKDIGPSLHSPSNGRRRGNTLYRALPRASTISGAGKHSAAPARRRTF